MKANTTSRKSTTPKGVKSTTTTKTAKSKDLATEVVKAAMADAKAGKQAPTQEELAAKQSNTTSKEVNPALVEQTAKVISNDLKKQPKSQPTAEELAAKQQKKLISQRDKYTEQAIQLTKGEVLDPANWLKVFKKNFLKVVGDKTAAKQLDSKWGTLCFYTKMLGTGSCVLEEYIKKDDNGVERKFYAAHMVRFEPTDKVGNKTILAKKPTAFIYNEEAQVEIKSEKDLIIMRPIEVSTKITKVIDGEEYHRTVKNVVLTELKPYEVFTLSYGEFRRAIKKAIAIAFPDGFAE